MSPGILLFRIVNNPIPNVLREWSYLNLLFVTGNGILLTQLLACVLMSLMISNLFFVAEIPSYKRRLSLHIILYPEQPPAQVHP